MPRVNHLVCPLELMMTSVHSTIHSLVCRCGPCMKFVSYTKWKAKGRWAKRPGGSAYAILCVSYAWLHVCVGVCVSVCACVCSTVTGV